MNRRFAILLAALLSIALPLIAQVASPAVEWKTYSYPVCGFSIAFPSPPAERTKRDPLDFFNDKPPSTYEYTLELPGGGLSVTASDLSSIADKKMGPEEILKVLRDENVKKLSACSIKERKIEFDAHPGVEIEAQCKEGVAVERYYVVDTMLYTLLVAGEAGHEMPDARRFFESFALIARTKPPVEGK